MDRPLLDVYDEEFPYLGRDYLGKAMDDGRLIVNGEKVLRVLRTGPFVFGHNGSLQTHKLKHGQLVVHKTHRHEPPSTDERPEVDYLGFE